MDGLVVASFNVHGGVDGWGRPFDVVDVCRRLDADILVLQEAWSPRDRPGLVEVLAGELGYEARSFPMTSARLYDVPPGEPDNWGPLGMRRPGVGLRTDCNAPGDPAESRPGTPGTVSLAMLSRVPLRSSGTLPLFSPRSDPARRAVLWAEVETGAGPLVVAGTHLSHLRHGSPRQMQQLSRQVAGLGHPAVVMGDLNVWGPPLAVLMPGWHRTVRGRSWPSWRPVFQIDHIVVSPSLRERVVGEVVQLGRSDHYPVRAAVRLCKTVAGQATGAGIRPGS